LNREQRLPPRKAQSFDEIRVSLTTLRRKAYGFPVVELPNGTVTLLFTAIEGSTRLLKQLGEPAVYQEQPEEAVHNDTRLPSIHLTTRTRRNWRTETYGASLVRPSS
jgi:hypothetical protein